MDQTNVDTLCTCISIFDALALHILIGFVMFNLISNKY